ncbi:hypothetical protein ACE1SV_05430 [Streptomyces sennicomposti]
MRYVWEGPWDLEPDRAPVRVPGGGPVRMCARRTGAPGWSKTSQPMIHRIPKEQAV